MKRLMFSLLAIIFAIQGWSQPVPASMPWTCDFENTQENSQWIIDNGPCINQWVFGTAVTDMGIMGASLYVSNDNGQTNTYENGKTAVVASRQLVSNGADSYMLQFDFRCRGESSSDGAKVFLVDDTVNFTASNASSLPAWAAATYSTDVIAVGKGKSPTYRPYFMNGYVSSGVYDSSSYHVNIIIPGSKMGDLGTIKKLVIVWTSDGSVCNPPAAAFDNFSFSDIQCSSPSVVNVSETSITSNSADVSWDSIGAASQYELQYKKSNQSWDDASVQNATVMNIMTNSYSLTNLESGTTYNVRVRSICNYGGSIEGADFGYWSEDTSFTTNLLCFPITAANLPFIEDFSNTPTLTQLVPTSIPNCWTNYDNYSPAAYNFPAASVDGTDTACYFYAANTYFSILYTPQFDQTSIAPNTLRIQFRMKPANAAALPYGVQVKVFTNIDTSSYINVGDLVTNEGLGYEDHEVYFNIPALENITVPYYIAIELPAAGNSTHYAWIDDIKISHIPLCGAVSNCEVSNVTDSAAIFSWTSNTGSYELQYKPSSESDWTNASVAMLNNNSYSFSDLLPNTSYDVRIRAICGSGDVFEEDYSDWRQVSFNTDCNAIEVLTTTPWTESFEGLSTNTMPNCWAATNLGSIIYTTTTTGTGRTPHTGTGFLYFKATHIPANDSIYTPDFVLTAGNQYKISFWYMSNAPTSYSHIGINMYNSSTDDIVASIGTPLTAAASSYTKYEQTFSPAYNGKYYFAIRCVGSGSILSAKYLSIDDITLELLPDCPDVNGFAIANTTNNSVVVSWDTTANDGNTWKIAYGYTSSTTFDPDAATQISVSATEMPYTIQGLTADSSYTFAIQTDCGGDWTTPLTITIPNAVTLPYNQDFEDLTAISGITFHNNTATNEWFVGSATGNTGNSMYISNDSGTTNTYDNTLSGYSYAVLNVDFGQYPEYTLSFDWKAVGEADKDFMRVYICPITATIPTNDYPSGTQIGGNFCQSNTWQNAAFTLSGSTYSNTLKKVVFVWRNDASVGSNPPIAVDNIVLKGNSCLIPTNYSIENIVSTGATAVWSSQSSYFLVQYKPSSIASWEDVSVQSINVADTFFVMDTLIQNTEYDFRVRTVCDNGSVLGEDFSNWIGGSFRTACGTLTLSDIPYSENFDNTPTLGNYTTSFPFCWTGTSTYPYSIFVVGATNNYSVSAPASMYLSGYGETHTYVTSPAIDSSLDLTTLKVKFKIRTANSSSLGLQGLSLGIMTNPADWTTFTTIVDSIQSSTVAWEDKEILLSSATISNPTIPHYIALAIPDGDMEFMSVYIDDFIIDTVPTCSEPYDFVANITNIGADNEVTITWDTLVGASDGWTIAYDETDSTSFDFSAATSTVVTADDYPFVVNNLMSGSTYTFAIRTNCGSDIVKVQIKIPSVQSAPYTQDFENLSDVNEWIFNSNTSDKWTIGNATGNTGNSMYVSADNGATNSYSQNNALALASMFIEFGSDTSYTLTYDWQGKGEGNSTRYDYVRVFLLPANASLPTTISNMPVGTDTLSNYLNDVANPTQWHHDSIMIEGAAYANTIKRLVFAWRTDGFTINDTAVAIDNISLTANATATPCYAPDGLALSGTPTQSSATVVWNQSSTAAGYQIGINTTQNLTPVSDTFYTFTGLTASTNYTIFLRSDCGNGAYSEFDSLTFTTAATPCDMPTNLQATNITQNSAQITWSAGSATAWQVATDTTATPTDVSSTTYTFSDLTPNTSYTYYVRTVCGTSDYSLWAGVSFTTEAVINPSVTTNDAVFNTTDNTLTLNGTLVEIGTPATTEMGFIYGTAANLTYTTSTVEAVTPIVEGDFTKTVSGLTPGTTYFYNTFARKDDGTYVYGTEKSVAVGGLGDIDNNFAINIYPNPATHTATLSLEGLKDDATITITDLTGKVIATQTIKSNQKTLTLNVKHYAAGIYYIRILNNDINRTQKLIVNK
ncbi:MAG: fibronectin type III domain-containing protein [Bacteroidales bacterium]|jgi:hypothetical protein|nr:fibronectin type III domain-containing protein [Bacteroidales bacterium]